MTAADLQEYVGVIDRMKSSLNSADFDQVFSLLTSDLPKSKQFLLKMELKRMAQPCSYFIDLRGHVDGDVKPYDYMGKTHYMDDNAIKVFEAGLKQYGSYTLGLYEEVLNTENNFRVMHRKQTEDRVRNALQNDGTFTNQQAEAEPELPPQYARVIHFGQYTSRRDERMHFSIDVEVELDGKRFQASTSDLSVSGCKLKLQQAAKTDAGKLVKLHFTGLEQEFMLGLEQGVAYKIVEVSQQGAHQYLRLQRQQNETVTAEKKSQAASSGRKRRGSGLKASVQKELRRAYYRKSLQWHPDRWAAMPIYSTAVNGAFQLINDAYGELMKIAGGVVSS